MSGKEVSDILEELKASDLTLENFDDWIDRLKERYKSNPTFKNTDNDTLSKEFFQKSIRLSKGLLNLNYPQEASRILELIEPFYENSECPTSSIEATDNKNDEEKEKWLNYANYLKNQFEIDPEIIIKREKWKKIFGSSKTLKEEPPKPQIESRRGSEKSILPPASDKDLTLKIPSTRKIIPQPQGRRRSTVRKVPLISPLGEDFGFTDVNNRSHNQEFYKVEKQAENIFVRPRRQSSTGSLRKLPELKGSPMYRNAGIVHPVHKKFNSEVFSPICNGLLSPEEHMDFLANSHDFSNAAEYAEIQRVNELIATSTQYVNSYQNSDLSQGNLSDNTPYSLNPDDARSPSFTGISRSSTDSTTNSQPKKYGDLGSAALAIQSVARRLKCSLNYKNSRACKRLCPLYITYGRKIINGEMYFITITKEEKHEAAMKELRWVYYNVKSNENNVLLQAEPLTSNVPKPKYTCYTVNEICCFLGVNSLDNLDENTTRQLLEAVKIEEGAVIFNKEEPVKEPKKRLIFRGKSKMRTEDTYFIRAYIIEYEDNLEKILLNAQSPNNKKEILLEPRYLMEGFKFKTKDILISSISKIVEFLWIDEGMIKIDFPGKQ